MLLAGTNLDPHQTVVNTCGNRRCVRREHLVVATISVEALLLGLLDMFVFLAILPRSV